MRSIYSEAASKRVLYSRMQTGGEAQSRRVEYTMMASTVQYWDTSRAKLACVAKVQSELTRATARYVNVWWGRLFDIGK